MTMLLNTYIWIVISFYAGSIHFRRQIIGVQTMFTIIRRQIGCLGFIIDYWHFIIIFGFWRLVNIWRWWGVRCWTRRGIQRIWVLGDLLREKKIYQIYISSEGGMKFFQGRTYQGCPKAKVALIFKFRTVLESSHAM